MTSVDKLTIETPEQTPLEFSLAGIGSRFLALALDSLIQLTIGIFLVVVWALVVGGIASVWRGGWTWVTALALLAFFLLTVGYFAIFEALWNGQTPGKRFLRLRVIKDSGHPITVYDAMARNLMRMIDQLPVAYTVGVASMLISSQNKRLGDYVGGTVVVYERPFEEVQPIWRSPEKKSLTLPVAARLLPEELHLIEAFLERRAHLSDEVRKKTAEAIADRIGNRLQIPNADRRETEDFLQTIAAQGRNLGQYLS